LVKITVDVTYKYKRTYKNIVHLIEGTANLHPPKNTKV